MKQIVQYQKTGEIFIEELPEPQVRDGYVLVRNTFSLISSGTEKSSVKTAQASMVGKARSRPDLVEQVVSNVKREGILATYKKVQNRSNRQSPIVVGFIGAGNFAQSYLLPTLVKIGVRLRGVVTSRPVNALSVQKKFGFGLISTNAIELVEDPDINTIFVATRHDSHAKYVVDVLKRGKHVFVEKPLAVNREQLTEVCKIAGELSDQALMVGFNRRFSKSFGDIKSFFSNRREPFVINYRVNAGFVPKSNWYQDPANGGRIVGEVCHFRKMPRIRSFRWFNPLRGTVCRA